LYEFIKPSLDSRLRGNDEPGRNDLNVEGSNPTDRLPPHAYEGMASKQNSNHININQKYYTLKKRFDK
jgi:hypothetical protein